MGQIFDLFASLDLLAASATFPPNACRGERCGVWGRIAPIKPVRPFHPFRFLRIQNCQMPKPSHFTHEFCYTAVFSSYETRFRFGKYLVT